MAGHKKWNNNEKAKTDRRVLSPRHAPRATKTAHYPISLTGPAPSMESLKGKALIVSISKTRGGKINSIPTSQSKGKQDNNMTSLKGGNVRVLLSQAEGETGKDFFVDKFGLRWPKNRLSVDE